MKIKLTESKIRQIVNETINSILNEDNDRIHMQAQRQQEMVDWATKLKKQHNELVNYLQKCGIESAELDYSIGGTPIVSVSSDEFNKKGGMKFADKYAESKGGVLRQRMNGATTYLSLDGLKESEDKFSRQQEEMMKYAQEDKQMHMELQNYLQKMGVESAKIGQFPSGAYYVGVYTPEYNKKQVYKIVDGYAKRLGMVYDDDQYPATTKVSLRKY